MPLPQVPGPAAFAAENTNANPATIATNRPNLNMCCISSHLLCCEPGATGVPLHIRDASQHPHNQKPIYDLHSSHSRCNLHIRNGASKSFLLGRTSRHFPPFDVPLRFEREFRLTMTERLSFKTAMTFAYGEPAPVAPGIVRIVAKNPGPLTFRGTNSYLIGMTELAVIDPGPDDGAHIDAIISAANGRKISHIFLTHAHRDHVDGTARLKDMTGARVCAFPRGPGKTLNTSHHPAQTEYVNAGVAIDQPLADGAIVTGQDWALEAIHTPGHAPDHLCFALQKRGVVFSGDHVMSWNTTVVGPPEGVMSHYMKSLERLLGRGRDKLYLPGHGDRLEKPRRTVRAYLLHRRWREQSILSAIREGGGGATIPAIVANVYEGLAPNLMPAAALSVLGHVEHLIEQGFVACEGAPTFDRPLYPA